MLKVRVKKKGKSLENIKKAVKKLDGTNVQSGFFSQQGMHIGGEYSYPALAQALELGYFPKQGINRVPMPFMKQIAILSYKGLPNDPLVKRAFKQWKKKATRQGNPKDLLIAIGERYKNSSHQVFNNPAYFPQAPSNLTPLFETGDLRNHFTYKTSWDNKVRN